MYMCDTVASLQHPLKTQREHVMYPVVAAHAVPLGTLLLFYSVGLPRWQTKLRVPAILITVLSCISVWLIHPSLGEAPEGALPLGVKAKEEPELHAKLTKHLRNCTLQT